MIDIKQHFPEGYTPTSMQLDVVGKVSRAFEKHKFVILNAPTGTGKSFIAKTVCNCSSEASKDYKEYVNSYTAYKGNDCKAQDPAGAFILTITKNLQDQYSDQFEDIVAMKGKSNYQCTYDTDFACDTAPCVHMPSIKRECWANNSCPYYEARNSCFTEKVSTLNYPMFFSLPKHLKYKEYIVCDEASELETRLVDEFTCMLDVRKLKTLGLHIKTTQPKNYSKIGVWLQSICNDLEIMVEDFKERAGSSNGVKKKQLSAKMIVLMNIHCSMLNVIENWNVCEYITEFVDGIYSFKPLKVDKIAHKLFDYGDKVLLMSATIIDPANFAKELGITDYEYIEVDSPFAANKAPIITSSKVCLSYKTMKMGLPKIGEMVKMICDKHVGDKGLIHTHSNAITTEMTKYCIGDRFLIRRPGTNNEQLLSQHAATDQPTVILSPSMSYGVDMKGDLARFQIILKAPFLPIGDARIKRRMNADSDWYQNQMLCSLVQSSGRGNRSEDDYCVTYILDGTIVKAIMRGKSKLPKYFLDRFI